MKTIDLRRHTDNDGDVLSPEGVRTAVAVGRTFEGAYQVGVSSGAQRATQTLACFLAGHGSVVAGGVAVDEGLRSDDEDRWREIAGEASGSDLGHFRDTDEAFVDQESRSLADALRRVIDRLADGERALVVGHSPTNEAAVYGLTGDLLESLGKGEGVRIVGSGDDFEVAERLAGVDG